MTATDDFIRELRALLYRAESEQATGARLALMSAMSDPTALELVLDVVEGAKRVRALENAREYKPTELEAATMPPEAFTADGFVSLRFEHKEAFRIASKRVAPALDALEAHLKERAK